MGAGKRCRKSFTAWRLKSQPHQRNLPSQVENQSARSASLREGRLRRCGRDFPVGMQSNSPVGSSTSFACTRHRVMVDSLSGESSRCDYRKACLRRLESSRRRATSLPRLRFSRAAGVAVADAVSLSPCTRNPRRFPCLFESLQ